MSKKLSNVMFESSEFFGFSRTKGYTKLSTLEYEFKFSKPIIWILRIFEFTSMILLFVGALALFVSVAENAHSAVQLAYWVVAIALTLFVYPVIFYVGVKRVGIIRRRKPEEMKLKQYDTKKAVKTIQDVIRPKRLNIKEDQIKLILQTRDEQINNDSPNASMSVKKIQESLSKKHGIDISSKELNKIFDAEMIYLKEDGLIGG